jgi:hypothetical protein
VKPPGYEVAFRFLTRVGVVLLLLLAAVFHLSNMGEYPGLTRPSLWYAVSEVVPLVAIAVVNLAAAANVDALRRGPGRLLAPAASIELLVYGLVAVGRGAAPGFFAMAGIGALLAIGSVGLVASRYRYGADGGKEW